MTDGVSLADIAAVTDTFNCRSCHNSSFPRPLLPPYDGL